MTLVSSSGLCGCIFVSVVHFVVLCKKTNTGTVRTLHELPATDGDTPQHGMSMDEHAMQPFTY